MSESTKIVEVIVGHSSHRLPGGPRDNGHTHQWTIFVKPANKEFDNFLDNKLIQKVKFGIHETFPNPVRVITKPPFKVTETGFASFPALVHIYLNLPNHKPHAIPYELVLFTGESDIQEDIQKLVIREEHIPSSFLDQVKKYARTKKRKASMISTHSDKSSKSPQEWKKKVKKEEPTFEEDEKRKEKKVKHSKEHEMIIPKIEIVDAMEPPKHKETKDRPDSKRERKSKTPEKPPKSAEELARKVKKISDPYVMYKVSEFLLTLPKTTINEKSLKLNFDLSQSSPDTLNELSKVMKSAKKSKGSN